MKSGSKQEKISLGLSWCRTAASQSGMPEVSWEAEEGTTCVPALSKAQLSQTKYLQIMGLCGPDVPGRSPQTPHIATQPQADKTQSSPFAPSPGWLMWDQQPQLFHSFWHW